MDHPLTAERAQLANRKLGPQHFVDLNWDSFRSPASSLTDVSESESLTRKLSVSLVTDLIVQSA